MKLNLKNNAILSAVLTILSVHPISASIVDDSNAIELAAVLMKDLKICHQLEWRNLSISLEYESELHGKSLNVSLVKEYVRQFLNEYPNETDFWEIMNGHLVRALLQEFPDMQKLKSVLSLKPDRTLSFPRESTVIYDINTTVMKESFGFTKLNYKICSETFQSIDLSVSFDLKANPAPFDYPDYQWVDDAMNKFFKDQPLSFSKWETLKPQLESFLLENFATLSDIQVSITLAK